MRSLESWILSFLLNSLWQIPLLFVAGLAAARALRSLGPAAEHRVWVGVLLLASLLPAASTLPWQWLRAHIPWGAAPSGDAHVTVVMGAGTGLGALPLPTGLLAAVAIAYSLLCAWFAARFLWRWMRLGVLRRDAVEAVLTGEAAACWEQSSNRFRIENVSIATSSRIVGPVTMGFARKLVLIPAGWLSGPPRADLPAVIAHELAHIRRHDFLRNLFYEWLALPVCYHPVFRAARARMIETREMVCDQMAAEADGRHPYARSLLRLASLLSQSAPPGTPYALGISDANSFERRLMRLTERQNEVRGMRRLIPIFACATLTIATCGTALALHVGVDGLSADHPPAQPSGPVAVSPKIMQGQRISGPVPVYPPDAKKARIQGRVLLDAVIGKDGTVEKLTVNSGPEALQKSALDAVHQWVYKPFLLNGEPIEVKTTITVVYSLSK
jgi:TonB family protein